MRGPQDIRLHDLRTTRDPHLMSRVYADVLAPSFEDEEMDSLHSLADGLASDGDPLTLATAAVDGGAAVGALVGEYYRRSGVLLIAYIAVRPHDRGRGIGSRLLTEVAAGWCRERDVALALAEVHDPRHYVAIEGSCAAARLRFFMRRGGRILRVPFTQPALAPNQQRVRHMLLVAVHVSSHALVRQSGSPSLEPSRLRAFVRDYYMSAEGKAPPDDEYAALQSRLQEPIPMLTMAQLDAMGTGAPDDAA